MTLVTPRRLTGASPAHARSRTQEKALAVRVGGKTIKASGAGDERGDVRLRGFVRLEAKTTRHASFSVTESLVDKLESAVVGTDEVPIMQIELRLGARKLIVMPDWSLDLLINALQAAKERT